MLIKNVKGLLICTFLFFNSSAKADINNYIVGNDQNKITQRITSFFTKYPNARKVFWVPYIEGKSRYVFSIQRDAYLNSKKYFDASDLYYLSKKIDQGLKFQPNEFRNIDISFINNNFNATYRQQFLFDLNTGVFFEKKENSFGILLNKNFILSKNSMANVGLKQTLDEFTIFNVKYVKLSENEDFELNGNLNHEFNSDILNAEVGITWFEIGNQFDFTVAIRGQDNKLQANSFATYGAPNMKFQIGFNQIRYDSNINMFFNLKFENNLDFKKLKTKVIITSKKDDFGLSNLSLKRFRKKNLDVLWKKYMNYN
jgi:hypothetical protein